MKIRSTKKVQATVRNSRIWIERFKRTGDLVHCVSRFEVTADTDVFHGLKEAGLETFEHIREDFRFAPWQSDRTRLDDFTIGKSKLPTT